MCPLLLHFFFLMFSLKAKQLGLDGAPYSSVASTYCTFLVYSLNSWIGSFPFSECKNYQILSSADRKVTYHTRTKLCDNTLGPGWFRFQGDAGTKMPTSCTPQNRCGSYGTGWLTGVHPWENEGTVTRKACFNYPNSCCRFSNNIKVRNCSGYYVYYLTGTICNVRYCGTD